MLSTLSSFQRQLSSIMETLVQTAVLEISRLVDVECEVLLSELTRSRSEICSLRHTLSSTEDTGQTLTQSSTPVKSEYAQEEMQNHLNRCSNKVLFRDSPTVIQQDQQKCEVNQPIGMIKQELHEVDVWIGQDNSEVGTHCGEAVSLSPTKDVRKIVPCVDRKSRENASVRVPSKSESLNKSSSPGEMMVNQPLSMKRTSEPENTSFSHTQSLSASKSTRTCSANTMSGDKRFVCTYCSKWFRCFSQLTIHQRSHTGEKPYRCTLCGKRYIQKGHLYTHQRTHTGEKPYRCPLCGKGFIQKCTLDMHLRSHTGEKPYTCIKCGKRFTTKFNLNKHLSCQSCNNIS
ncbi:zinc finger and SCAN domain-containing protein 2 [Rhinichthys klamathensis goyatoka]|uniref:zinc finger and SCAN domain-containing protein 2 n=1 Tax=Rhinichthys klamathensis goyatoka TaxID=3034132 RepID=UPI0024B59857|nr:zinc finger and SCAN domain-containing protein 2 [Rhinichthys klamathensis goyatoka]